MLDFLKKIIPHPLFKLGQPIYHYSLAFLGAVIYGFPSKKIRVIGVTGTKGKTTVTEVTATLFKAGGYKVASSSTVQFSIGENSKRNLYKMTMPGRFFVQKFLYNAIREGCDTAIIEMSSEGARQYRHKFIELDALIFTNLSPEHIESHGSYEKYVAAKLAIAKTLEKSTKPKRAIIANKDDIESEKFLSLDIKYKIPYSASDLLDVKSSPQGSSFQLDKTVIHTPLHGSFNIQNIAGAVACARHFGITDQDIKKGLENITLVRGRMEKIQEGQDFEVVVDYAHTRESLDAIYSAYGTYKKICVLGNTGGGRDTWKRPAMARVAEEHCDYIILTNEDPYDEDPEKIIEEMREVIVKKPVEVILDRREAIRHALKKAVTLRASDVAKALSDEQGASDQKGLAVLITGKGTDPYIMGPNGTKQEWDDATVVREEIKRIMNKE